MFEVASKRVVASFEDSSDPNDEGRSAIFTADIGRGLRFAERVRTGWVNVNEGTNYWESHLPFGGRAGSASGVGRVGGRFSLERLTELKTIVVHLG